MKNFILAAALMCCGSVAFAQDSRQDYAAQCAAAVGTIPEFSCAEGDVVPITVNGQTPTTYTPNMLCDKPALLNNGAGSDGQCVPYSRIVNKSVGIMQVSAMCRQKTIRSADSLEYDEIDIIAHNLANGATCWFQAGEKDGVPVDGSKVLSPQSAASGTYWEAPETVAGDDCGGCHDNDPFMYSPFVGQVWENIPTDPFGLYHHVAPEYGFGEWPVTQMQPRDSTCTGCHRIGIDKTCSLLTEMATGIIIPPGAGQRAAEFPGSHFMPPDHNLTKLAWNIIHASSVETIRACCSDNSAAQCNTSAIPGAKE